MKKEKYNYAKKITSRTRNLTKLEREWCDLCERNGRDNWIRWKKGEKPRQEFPIFCSCDKFDGCDSQQFETIKEAIEWEKGYK